MRSPPASTTTGFDELLAGFRNGGCTLLVVGETPPEARRAATQRLLGDPGAGRTRLLVTAADDPEHRLPGSLTPEANDTHVIEAADGVRGPGDVGDPRSLSEVEAEIEQTLSELAPERGFQPGVLRVGVDDLLPLMSAHGYAEAREFLERMREAVTEVRGMGHALLPVEYGDPAEKALRPAVDAVIEQRPAAEGGHEERWHVPETGMTTPWFRLD